MSGSNQEEKAGKTKNAIKKVVTGKDMEQYPLTTDKNYKHSVRVSDFLLSLNLHKMYVCKVKS